MKIDQWYGSDDSPLLEKGILFLYSTSDYAVDVETGEKLYFQRPEVQQKFRKTFSDSLIVFDHEERIVVVNLYTGEELFNKRRKKSSYAGDSNPVLTNQPILVITADRGETSVVEGYHLQNREVVWSVEPKGFVYSQPVYHEGFVLLFVDSALQQLDIKTGQLVHEVSVGSSKLRSSLKQKGNKIFVWIEEQGLLCINIETQKIIWSYVEDDINMGSCKLVINDTTLYFANRHIYALDISSGKLLWKSQTDCVSSSYHLARVSNFILFYQNCYDAYDQIFALDLATKKLKYMSFTSEDFMPEQEDQYVHILDYLKLDFTANTYNGIIVATDKEYVYAFKIAQQAK